MAWVARKHQDPEGQVTVSLEGPVGDEVRPHFAGETAGLDGMIWAGQVRHPATNALLGSFTFVDATTATAVDLLARFDSSVLTPDVTYIWDIIGTKDGAPMTLARGTMTGRRGVTV